mgnify:CR=1 FL=1
MLMRAESYDGGIVGAERARQKSSVFRPSPYYELVPGMKTNVTNFKGSLYIDKNGNKLNYKPSGKHKDSTSKNFFQKFDPKTGLQITFPKRARFNEDARMEI